MTHLQAVPTDRYVTRRELAHIMQCSVSKVDRLVGEGMPSYRWGRRSRRFLAKEALDWAQTRRF